MSGEVNLFIQPTTWQLVASSRGHSVEHKASFSGGMIWCDICLGDVRAWDRAWKCECHVRSVRAGNPVIILLYALFSLLNSWSNLYICLCLTVWLLVFLDILFSRDGNVDRMNCNNFGDLLTFHLVMSSSQHFNLSNTRQSNSALNIVHIIPAVHQYVSI